MSLHVLPSELSVLARQENGTFVPPGDEDLGLSSACKVHLNPTALTRGLKPLSKTLAEGSFYLDTGLAAYR